MIDRKRIVFIGAGGRAISYCKPLLAEPSVELVACADPNPSNRRTFLGLNNVVGKLREFDDWRVMLDACAPVDGVIITTPNYLHAEPAIESIDRGCVLALEKPIAATATSCQNILDTYLQKNARALVGFVMHSAPFYLQARKWIAQGKIGEVVSIHAEELPHVMTTSVMFRSDWRRFKKTSGGSLLEKCCHDVDMLTWMAGSRPARLSAMAGVKTFRPNPELPGRCDECRIQSECVYYLPPSTYNHPDQIRKSDDGVLYQFVRDNSACIYNNGHDIYDHYNVQIQYENGVIGNLLLDFACSGKSVGRWLKVIGTRGVIHGKLEENRIHLHDKRTDREETVELKLDDSGHAGANDNHALAFARMLHDKDFAPPAGVEAGYLSAMLCFAAEQSIEQKRQVDVSDLYWNEKIVAL